MESNKGLFSYLTWLLPKELIRTWRARLQAVRSWVPSETEAGGAIHQHDQWKKHGW